jgi:polysaccharide export outer membrane protein
MSKTLFKISFFLFVVLCSCTSHRNMIYMRSGDDEQLIKTLNIDSIYQYTLRPGDVLGIEVNNTVVAEKSVFSEELDKTETNSDPLSKGYLIDRAGNVELPLVGKMYAKDKTIEQFKQELEIKLAEYINYPYVKVTLLSFKITLLGEVRIPGTYPVIYSSINLFEALAMGNDITDFGNKREVKIIRKNNGQYDIITLDLTDEKTLTSSYFMMHPDDIVYVKPVKAKLVKINSSLITLTVSTVTILVLLTNYFRK